MTDRTIPLPESEMRAVLSVMERYAAQDQHTGTTENNLYRTALAAIATLRGLLEEPVQPSLASPALSAQPQGEREAFEAWADGIGSIGRIWRSTEPGCTGTYGDSWTQMAWRAWQARASLSASTPSAEARDMSGLSAVIAGALFDFAGYLTTRDKVIEVGSTAMAGPVADLLRDWASDRGLSLEDAAVLSWQELIAAMAPPADNKENGNV